LFREESKLEIIVGPFEFKLVKTFNLLDCIDFGDDLNATFEAKGIEEEIFNHGIH
jgi:hypothetical protein